MKAYVTVLSDNSYINGVVVLYRSLMNTGTKYPLYAIVTPDVNQENINTLEKLNIGIIHRNQIIPPKMKLEDGKAGQLMDVYGWHKAMVKLSIFGLTQFEKLVYLDSDIVVLKNIDELFDKPHMSAIKDFCGMEDIGPEDRNLCSGTLVIEPDEYEYKNILRFVQNFDGQGELIHDQWIIQEYYPVWKEMQNILRLPVEYGCWTTFYSEEDLYYPKKDIKILHIIDRKPWTQSKEYFHQCETNWPAYSKLCLWYIDLLNYTIKWLSSQGITNKYLKIIE